MEFGRTAATAHVAPTAARPTGSIVDSGRDGDGRRHLGIESARKSQGRGVGEAIFALIAAVLFGVACLGLIALQSVAGNTVAEVFYNLVGIMSLGLAALSIVIGSSR